MVYFDTHCHLGDRAFAGDRDEVLDRARRAGVVGLLCVGYDVASSKAALSLAVRYPHVWAVVGVHPHDAARAGKDYIRLLKDMAENPKVVAIGETGLDFYRDLSPRPAQREAFLRHIELAQASGLPLVVHDREAHDETLDILSRCYGPPAACAAGARERRSGVMHCFAGDAAMAEDCLNLGFYLSFAGPLTFPKAERARAVVTGAPLDRLLIETDSPYLAPQNHRGRRNEPAYVPAVAEAMASARGATLEDVARQTTANAGRLFGIMTGGSRR